MVPSLGKEPEGQGTILNPLMTFQRAFMEPHASDAHFVCYHPTDDSDSFPRLNKSRACLQALQGKATFAMVWMSLDIDLPGHEKWSNDKRFSQQTWFSDQTQRIQTLAEGRIAGIYHTRGGYRLLWPLATPMAPAQWETMARELIAKFRAAGIPCDDLKDWTRLFRLPWVLREGQQTERYADFESMEPLSWTPGAAPAADPFLGLVLPAKLRRALERGDSLAPHGERHNMILSVLGTLLRTMVPIDPDRAVRLIQRSLETMIAEGSRHTLEQVSRMASEIAEREQESRRSRVTSGGNVLELIPSGSSPAPSEDILGSIQQDMAAMPPAPFLQSASGTQVWVWSEKTASFVGPYARTTMLPAFEQHSPAGAPAITRDALGNARKPDQLLLESGRIFDSIQYELGRDRAVYDATNARLRERAGEFRQDLTPAWNAHVDRWLRSFAPGQEEHWLSWLATIRWVSRPTCAYYLHTAPGAGKQLLLTALSALWKRRAHTVWRIAIQKFNTALRDAPLICADEEMSVEKDQSPTAILRELVGNTQHQLQVKHSDDAYLLGALRVLITANNPGLIKTERESLSQEDLRAVIDRISYVYSGNAPVHVLRETAGWEETNRWLEQDVITRHVLALEHEIAPWTFGARLEDRVKADSGFKPGPRFLVHGVGSRYHQNLINRSGVTRQTLTALCYLLQRGKQGMALDRVSRKPGPQLVVNAAKFYDNWRLLFPDERRPAEHAVSLALKSLAVPGNEMASARDNAGNPFRGYNLRVEDIVQHALMIQLIADEEEFLTLFR